MKKYTDRFSTPRRDDFAADIDAPEDDFILADLHTRPDDTELTITPLHHANDDEDAIDRLLTHSGFDTDTGWSQTTNEHTDDPVVEQVIAPVIIDPPIEIPEDNHSDTALLVEILPEEQLPETVAIVPADFKVDTFISDYLAMRQPEPPGSLKSEADIATAELANKTEWTGETAIPRKSDNDATVEDVTDHVIGLIAKDPFMQRKHPEPDKQKTSANDINNATLIHELKAKQEHMEAHLVRLQKKLSTTIYLACAAIAFSIAILVSIAAQYTTVSDIKADITKLTEWVELLKEDMETSHAETSTEY